MNNESLEGCPRCSDYDEVVEELKKEKDTREQKAKSELLKCEERHKKKDTKIKGLEKKVLAMTIAAVVGGTIVGKEFIDEIASYLKSFNSVKDSATKLIGASPTDNNDNKVADNDDNNNENETEDIDDVFVLELAPRTFDTGEWPALVAQLDLISSQNDISSLSYLPYIDNSPLNDFLNPPTLTDILLDGILDDMVIDDYVVVTSASVSDALSSFGVQSEYIQEPNIPTYYAQEQTYIPESHAWLLLGVPLCFGRRRR